MDQKARALKLLGQIAGGGLAGLVDVETSQTMPLGLPVGALAGFGLAAAGFVMSGKNAMIGDHLGNLGAGMLAYESGIAVANRVIKMKAAAAAQPAPAAVAGMFGAHPGAFVSQTPVAERALSPEILQQHLARARQHAATARR